MRKLALFIAAAVLTGVAVAPTATAAASGGAACFDYEFIGARGSGEPAEAGLGIALGPMYKYLDKQIEAQGATVNDVALDYPAIALEAGTLLESVALVTGDYTASVSAGTQALAARINSTLDECPDTRFILGGYSQGAQVVDLALGMYTRQDAQSQLDPFAGDESELFTRISSRGESAISGIVLFGDPKFALSDAVNTSSFDPDHSGIWLPHDTWQLKHPALSENVISVCHEADPVCNITAHSDLFNMYYKDVPWVTAKAIAAKTDGGLDLFAPHTNYAKDAARIAGELTSSLGFVPKPAAELGVATPGSNVVYLLDGRSEMFSEQRDQYGIPVDDSRRQYLHNRLEEQVQYLENQSENNRWGLGEYGVYRNPGTVDHGHYSYVYHTDGEVTIPDHAADAQQLQWWQDEPDTFWGGSRSHQSSYDPTTGISENLTGTSEYGMPTNLLTAMLDAGTQMKYSSAFDSAAPKQIVVVTNRPNDPSANFSSGSGSYTESREHFPNMGFSTAVDWLKKNDISVSYWNPFADEEPRAADVAPASHTYKVASAAFPAPTDAMRTSTATTEGWSAEQMASATGGEAAVPSLQAAALDAAFKPSAQLSVPVSAEPDSDVSVVAEVDGGDYGDEIISASWTVIDPLQESVAVSKSGTRSTTFHTGASEEGVYQVAADVTFQSGKRTYATATISARAAVTSPPEAPDVTAREGSAPDRARLEWNPVADADYYAIYDNSGTPIALANPAPDSKGHLAWDVLYSVASGKTLHVRAVNRFGLSEQSAIEVPQPPVEPEEPEVCTSVATGDRPDISTTINDATLTMAFTADAADLCSLFNAGYSEHGFTEPLATDQGNFNYSELYWANSHVVLTAGSLTVEPAGDQSWRVTAEFTAEPGAFTEAAALQSAMLDSSAPYTIYVGLGSNNLWVITHQDVGSGGEGTAG